MFSHSYASHVKICGKKKKLKSALSTESHSSCSEATPLTTQRRYGLFQICAPRTDTVKLIVVRYTCAASPMLMIVTLLRRPVGVLSNLSVSDEAGYKGWPVLKQHRQLHLQGSAQLCPQKAMSRVPSAINGSIGHRCLRKKLPARQVQFPSGTGVIRLKRDHRSGSWCTLYELCKCRDLTRHMLKEFARSTLIDTFLSTQASSKLDAPPRSPSSHCCTYSSQQNRLLHNHRP